jgi:methyl-accepting chemotaxis protein
MKFTITNRLRATILGLGILAIGNVALVDSNVREIKNDVIHAEEASEVDILASKMTKFKLVGNDTKLAETQKMISAQMNVLRNGDAKMGLTISKDPIYFQKLDQLDASLKEFQQAIDNASRNSKANGELVAASLKVDEVAVGMEEHIAKSAEDHFKGMQLKEILLLIVNLAALAGIFVMIQRVAKTLTGSTAVFASTSTQIASTVEQQERSLAEQAASVNETTTTIEELGASSRQAAEQADASASGAQQAIAISGDGSRIVSRTMSGIGELREKVEAIADKIMQLSEQTAQISSISDMVSDIASQTNMLSLNAAVEAARAGEQGKGFAVVAGEVRKLAEQSKKSADKIKVLVAEVQTSINSTVMVTDEGTKTAAESIRLAEETAGAFNGIASSINDVFLNSQQIALSAKQQAVAVQQAVSAMNAINLGAKETAAGVSQVKAATKDLAGTAKELQAIV